MRGGGQLQPSTIHSTTWKRYTEAVHVVLIITTILAIISRLFVRASQLLVHVAATASATAARRAAKYIHSRAVMHSFRITPWQLVGRTPRYKY